jgi:hypothetical protein
MDRAGSAGAERGEGRFGERGSTRSGGRFAARNVPFYSTVRELLSHHQQLLHLGPVSTTRYAAVGSSRGSLLQTTIRFRSDHHDVRSGLLAVFSDLFRQHPGGGAEGGFEVVVTFNAIVSDSAGTSYSVFYGQDYGTVGGARRDLRYGASFLVSNPDDVAQLPADFDFDQLARTTRISFENSDLRIVRFLNIVYLAYQYTDGPRRRRRR